MTCNILGHTIRINTQYDKYIFCFFPETTEPLVDIPISCPHSCRGLADGPYQSCLGCDRFLVCYGEVLKDGYFCDEGKEFDDVEKKCVDHSTTCPSTPESTRYPSLEMTTVPPWGTELPEIVTSDWPFEGMGKGESFN